MAVKVSRHVLRLALRMKLARERHERIIARKRPMKRRKESA